MTEKLRCLIVDTHNELRKNISTGSIEGFDTASRRIELAWIEDLALNAQYTAKTCVYAHDSCRNTEKYNNVGQNIAMFSTKAIKLKDILAIIKGILDTWLNQAKNCNMTVIENFRSDSGGQVNDFAQMIRARCSQIGCAIVRFEANGTKNVFLVCNYSSANVPKEPVYIPGAPCSKCMAGCSFSVPGLCKNAEEHFILDLSALGGLLKVKLFG